MASQTQFWESEELCSTLELAYNTLKQEAEAEKQKQGSDSAFLVNQEMNDSFRLNFIKLLNILPFEMYIAK